MGGLSKQQAASKHRRDSTKRKPPNHAALLHRAASKLRVATWLTTKDLFFHHDRGAAHAALNGEGALNHGQRGLNILTDAGYLWVIDRDDVDPELLGRRVITEGIQAKIDRFNVEWLGEVR